jgi:hypothetical protein
MRTRGLSQDPVVIVGSPRSGTSWLMRLIARQPGYCAIFEPLHARWWPKARDAGFGNRPTTGDDRKRAYLHRVFKGLEARQSMRRPRWSRSVGANPGRLLWGTVKRLLAVRLVVKFVSACRLLPWMVEEFPDCRYVYLVRNPCAVVSSQLSRGASSYLDNRARPFDYLNEAKQPGLATTELRERIRADAAEVLDEDTVREIHSLEGCLIMSWYADNLLAQHASAQSEAVITVRYEDLLTNTSAELDRIHAHIGVRTPSSITLESKDPDRQLHKWRGQLTDRQIESIRETLHTLETAHEHLDKWNILGEACRLRDHRTFEGDGEIDDRG